MSEPNIHGEWQLRRYKLIRTCTYCGGIHPEDLIVLLDAGARLERTDWKYGWPHKFYVINDECDFWGKFYTTHMQDSCVTDEIRERVQRVTGILYRVRDGQLHYCCAG